MMNQIECTSINRKFENIRLKNEPCEKSLLLSIQKEGILQPLGCLVEDGADPVLLDGFKRLRAAVRLGITTVPITLLGIDEVHAVYELLFRSSEKSLNILEQAAFCDHLHIHHKIGVMSIADRLKKSPAWVSVRLGMLHEINPEIKQALFQGSFSVRAYMYTLKPFTRVNKIFKKDTVEFVRRVAGMGLSTRDIERLAIGFFKGGENLKEQIRHGNIRWTLKQLKTERVLVEGGRLNDMERKCLRDLEVLDQCLNRLILVAVDPRLKDMTFLKKARLLIIGIFERMTPFTEALGGLV